MSWLKRKLFTYQLNKLKTNSSKSENGVKNMTNFIGVLYDENHIDSLQEMKHVVSRWESKGKNLETFSFVNQKEFTEEEDQENKICKKDLTWFQMPKGPKVESFISKKYDVLITINPDQKQHLHFLNAASKAKFKIGLLPDNLNYYNLMIDCKQTNSVKTIFSDIQLTLDKLAG